MASENWRNSTVYVQVTEKSGTIRRGVKKWMTRAEMEKKWDKDITDAIIAYKNSSRSIYEEDVRAHPDAPESEVVPSVQPMRCITSAPAHHCMLNPTS